MRRLLRYVWPLHSLRQERDTYRNAYETTKADRDRLLPYEHAFATTRDDRDRIQALLDAERCRNDDILAGLIAYALRKDLGLDTQEIEQRLKPRFAGNSIRRASDGLLKVSDALYRHCFIGRTAGELTNVALALDNSFRGQDHAVHTYYLQSLGPQAYFDYLRAATLRGEWPDRDAKAAQASAIERGIPSIFLTTLPKSGSIYISSAVQASAGLTSYATAVSFSMMDQRVIPELAREFARGGVFSQGHIAASPQNVAALRASGVHKIVVHVRDPRQGAVSWWHYANKIGAIDVAMTENERDDYLIDKYVAPAIAFVSGWLEHTGDFDVLLSQQRDLAGNEENHIRSIFDFFGWQPETLVLPPKDERVHFRKGERNEWRSFFRPAAAARINAMMSPAISQMFE